MAEGRSETFVQRPTTKKRSLLKEILNNVPQAEGK